MVCISLIIQITLINLITLIIRCGESKGAYLGVTLSFATNLNNSDNLDCITDG